MSIVGEIIKAEIGQNGPISFARFMELALYCPGSGYYEKEADTLGKRGDFYTSVSVGSVFGHLLAFQFARWQQEISPSGRFQIVEAGAHHGQLAADILGWFQQRRPEALSSLEYWIVEPSASRQARQQERLREFGKNVRWAAKLADINGGVTGVIFSNELLDAMPVQRFAWDAQQRTWYERGVMWKGDKFVWTRLSAGEIPIPEQPPKLLDVLPDGYTLEVSLAVDQWWREAAMALRRGKLLTIDYGLTDDEILLPKHVDGTVRAYHRHKLVNDVLANPGEQDITAHIKFPFIRLLGESTGLSTEAFQTQSVFLTGIAKQAWAEGSGFGEWTQNQTRQFQTLTHPEHLGRAFHVLLQSR